ncbi:MAG TPA: hypothetical protein VLA34_04710 [Candidatus Krumholzibacterium sp.]|nr:hypothetical protein [Candidatus Krumholzibacterium sp.]
MKNVFFSAFVIMATILSGSVVEASAPEYSMISGPVELDAGGEDEGNRLLEVLLSGPGWRDPGSAGRGAEGSRPAARTSTRSGLRQWHRYLGYGTLILAGITAVSSSEKSVHYVCAYSATGAAVATCVTGYLKYGRRFNLSRGLLRDDNVHIILGVAGTVGMAAAVLMADSGEEGGHAAIGTGGGASMLVSLLVIKW